MTESEFVTYRCEVCGGPFKTYPAWTNDDAKAEYEQLYGAPWHPEDGGAICGLCFKRFDDWRKSVGAS